MPQVAKNLGKHGVLLAMETGSYGSGSPALVAGTDGFKVYETPEVELAMQFDGSREGATGTGMQTLPPVLPAARSGKFSLMSYWKGPGVAYGASSVSAFDKLWRGMGMSATLNATTDITYAPIVVDAALSSLVAEIYARKQKYSFAGVFCNKFTLASSGLAVPKATFECQGIVTSAPTDAAVPAITAFAPAVKNPKASNIALTLDTGGQAVVPICRDFTLTLERELVERVDQNDAAGNHPGFYIGDWKASLEVVIEATAAVTGSPYASAASKSFDAYRIYENMKEVDISLTLGATQYNQLTINAPTAHLSGFPTEDREGQIALWTLPFQLDASTEELLDNFTLVTS